MIKIKVNTENTPHYVLSTDLRTAIEAEFPADAAKDIAKKYSDLIYGSAALVLSHNPSTHRIPMISQQYLKRLMLMLNFMMKTRLL